MKSLSILEILTGLNKTGNAAVYTCRDYAKSDDKGNPVDCSSIAGDYVADERGKWRAYSLTAIGREVVNIFATIDAINKLDVDVTTTVIGDHRMSDYTVVQPLRMFIRPKKAVIAGETLGIKQLDAIVNYAPFCDTFKGEVLTPVAFENAQLRYLRAVNRRCNSLVGGAPVSRDVVTLTEQHIAVMPVILKGNLCAPTRGKNFEVFALKHQFYPEMEYIYAYNLATVQDAMISFATRFAECADARSADNLSIEG